MNSTFDEFRVNRPALVSAAPAVSGRARARLRGVPSCEREQALDVSEMAARYDLRARSYGRCWAPVLAPTALTLLDAVEPVIANAPPARLLDAGTGSGTLAIAATRRWPFVGVTGLDVSAGMLALARAAVSGQTQAPRSAFLVWRGGQLQGLPGQGIAPDKTWANWVSPTAAGDFLVLNVSKTKGEWKVVPATGDCGLLPYIQGDGTFKRVEPSDLPK